MASSRGLPEPHWLSSTKLPAFGDSRLCKKRGGQFIGQPNFLGRLGPKPVSLAAAICTSYDLNAFTYDHRIFSQSCPTSCGSAMWAAALRQLTGEGNCRGRTANRQRCTARKFRLCLRCERKPVSHAERRRRCGGIHGVHGQYPPGQLHLHLQRQG